MSDANIRASKVWLLMGVHFGTGAGEVHTRMLSKPCTQAYMHPLLAREKRTASRIIMALEREADRQEQPIRSVTKAGKIRWKKQPQTHRQQGEEALAGQAHDG